MDVYILYAVCISDYMGNVILLKHEATKEFFFQLNTTTAHLDDSTKNIYWKYCDDGFSKKRTTNKTVMVKKERSVVVRFYVKRSRLAFFVDFYCCSFL